MSSDLSAYRALVSKVDSFWDRALRAQPAAFCCAHGCDGCCGQRLTVFPVEAAAISSWLASRAPGRQQAPGRTGARADCCAFLLEGGCLIYPVRPIICRTHGLPVRIQDRIDCCPLNFTEALPEPEVILDLERINTLLAVVDRLHAEATGAPAGRPRIALAEIARDPLQFERSLGRTM